MPSACSLSSQSLHSGKWLRIRAARMRPDVGRMSRSATTREGRIRSTRHDSITSLTLFMTITEDVRTAYGRSSMPERSSVTIQVTCFPSISAKERLLESLRAGISVTLVPLLLFVVARFEVSDTVPEDARRSSEVTLAVVRGVLVGNKEFKKTPRSCSNCITDISDVRDPAQASP